MKKRIFSLGLALSLIFTQTPAYAMSTFSDGSEEIAVFDSEPALTSEPTAAESLQAIIDVLPTVEELEALNKEAQTGVYEQAQIAYDILENLEPDELAQIIDAEKLTAVMEWFHGQVITLAGESIPIDSQTNLESAVTSGGTVTLGADITIDKTLEITGTVTLDLNGYTLTYENSGTRGSVIEVIQGATFTLKDSSDNKTGKITGGTGTLLLEQYYGGGVYNKGTFIMISGNITNCSSTSGGGVYNEGTFTMQGGSISDCNAMTGGGVHNNKSFTMQGASIIDCSNYGRSSVFANNQISDMNFAINGGIVYGSITGKYIMEDNCCEVIYKTNNNITYATQWVPKNATITRPRNPEEKEGWEFGWYTDNAKTKEYFFSEQVNSNLTLYAGLTPINYSITYNLDNGTLPNSGNPTSYTIESNNIELENPIRDGYEFIGWSGTGLEGESNKTVTISQGSTGNRAYTAHWKDVTAPVILGIEDGQTYCPGDITITVTDNDAIKSVTVNGNSVTLTNGQFTLSQVQGTQTIIATDNTNNISEVTVTISHTPTLRGYRSATCTSNGYSGDTYCSHCNEKLASGGVISAYGHKYDDGVITTEPTTEKNGIKTYTCIHCKNTKTENLGRIGDGIPYLKGSFDKRGWDVLLTMIRNLKAGSGLSICMNGKTILPSEILAEVKGKDITLTFELQNGFTWTINGASVTSDKLTDMDLAVVWTTQNIPSALIKKAVGEDPYAGLHLSMPIEAGLTGNLSITQGYETTKVLWANLFRYDPITGTLLCTQAVPNGDGMAFSMTQGHDYLIVYSSQYFVGTVIDAEDSAADEELQPDRVVIKSTSVNKNKLTVSLESGCKGAEGYDIVVGKKDMLKTQDFRYVKYDMKSTKASFSYLPKGTWFIAGRAWRMDASGQKVYGAWSKVQKVKVTVKTPVQTKLIDVQVSGSTVVVTYEESANAEGYRVILGKKKVSSGGEKYPEEYTKTTKKVVSGKGTVTVTFRNVRPGTYYLGVRPWNLSTGTSEKVYGPWSKLKTVKIK